MAQDGRLKSVTVYGYQKRYDLEKYYTYILQVRRQNQPDPAYLFRSYKEFVELHQKLLIHFPLAKLHRFIYFEIAKKQISSLHHLGLIVLSVLLVCFKQFTEWYACWTI